MKGKIDIPAIVPVLTGAAIDEVRYHHISAKVRKSVRLNAVPPTRGFPATSCVLLRDGEYVTDSVSFLHPKDQFCRLEGRKASLRKAVRNLDVKNRRNGKK